MEEKYEKAMQMLRTSHLCPRYIADACGIDAEILHDMTDGCCFDDWGGSCSFCRDEALSAMVNRLNNK